MKSLGEQPADEISNAKVGFLVLVARRPSLRLHSEVAGVADGFKANGGFDGQFETAADADIPRLGDNGSDGSCVEVSAQHPTGSPSRPAAFSVRPGYAPYCEGMTRNWQKMNQTRSNHGGYRCCKW